ncbi:homoserine O-acetyltransferase [bacterium]|nr:homoserine O-acetyltransferase [bacterium]
MQDKHSVGLVKTEYYTFADPPEKFRLENGGKLGPVTLAYETYGRLNRNKSNAILITHALSGDAHVAGIHSAEDKKPGWWDFMIGPGKPFDTKKYFIICSNVIGGCKGSTGPTSVNPETGNPYNLDFPEISIGDMVNAQCHLIDHLGIGRLLAVAGGSMGGQQALQWAVAYPDRVAGVIPIATTARLNVQGIAFDVVGRQAITGDPKWKNGDYLNRGTIPSDGLAVARMLAHITYLSEDSMRKKFGRKRQETNGEADSVADFEVGSYLRYQGESFIRRFDANTYLYITKAIDHFDLTEEYGSLEAAFGLTKSKFLVMSFTSDWLFNTAQSKEIVQALNVGHKDVSFCEITSSYGHDAFLLPNPVMERLITGFLRTLRN